MWSKLFIVNVVITEVIEQLPLTYGCLRVSNAAVQSPIYIWCRERLSQSFSLNSWVMEILKSYAL